MGKELTDAQHLETWTEYSSRLSRHDQTAAYFNDVIAKGRTFKNVMSLGPGDCAVECRLVDTCFSQLEKMVLVENDPELVVSGPEAVRQKAGGKFNVEGVQADILGYQHTGVKMDLILMGHVTYYFLHNIESLLAKLKSWLADDGILVIISNDCPFMRGLNDLRGERSDEYIVNPDCQMWKTAAESVGLQAELSWCDYYLDTKGSDDIAYKWVWLLLNFVPDTEMVKHVADLTKKYTIPDTAHLGLAEAFLVAHK